MLLSLTINKITGFLLTLCFFSLLAKLVNLNDLGIILILLQLIVTFTLLLSLGAPFAANIIVSQDKSLVHDFLLKGLKILFFAAFPILPIAYFILNKIYFLNFNESLFFCLILILNTFLFYLAQIFQSIKYTNYSFLLNQYGMRGALLQLLFIVGLLLLHFLKIDFTIINIFKVISFSMLVQLIGSLYIYKKIKNNITQKIGLLNTKDIIDSGLEIGINRFIKSLIMPLTFTFIFYIYGQDISAIFQSNFRIIITLTAFSSSIILPTKIPDLRSTFEENKIEFKKLFLKIITITFLVNSFGMLLYLLIYQNAISIIYNEKFILVYNEIVVLILICIILNVLNTTSIFLNYTKNANDNSKLNLFGVLFSIGFFGILSEYDILFSIEMVLACLILIPYSLPTIKLIRVINN